MFHSLKALFTGPSQPNFTNLAFQPKEGICLFWKVSGLEQGGRPNRISQATMNPPRCLLPFVPRASKSVFVVALTSRTASGGKRTGRWRNAVQHYCHRTDWGSQKNLMYFSPLAPRSQLVIITGKIEQPKKCWTAQILNISFYFHREPFLKHPGWIGTSTCINLGLLTSRYKPNKGSIRLHKICSLFFLTECF